MVTMMDLNLVKPKVIYLATSMVILKVIHSVTMMV